MLKPAMRYAMMIGIVMIVAQDAAAWPRVRHRRCKCPPQTQVEQDPHAANSKHPAAVARIVKLLPQIPADESPDRIIAMLGIPKDCDGGHVSNTGCSMVWKYIAPGYHFTLAFDPEVKEGKLTLKFGEARFSAQHKPGFPPEEYHTVYPYRSSEGMVYK